ncbi:hypothetical protein THAOC_24040, partial [Thalassiosira oceanica]
FLEGMMDFALLPEYFGGSFDMEYAEKLAVEAFEEDGFEESKTKARLDELELFTPCAFFRTPLLFVRLFVCLSVCLFVCLFRFAPQKSGPPNSNSLFALLFLCLPKQSTLKLASFWLGTSDFRLRSFQSHIHLR